MNKLLEKRLLALLSRRKAQKAFRTLSNPSHLIDFCSNDYLSLARSFELQETVKKQFQNQPLGATGSRLLSGHYDLLDTLEGKLAQFHQAEAALVFNSGYNANLGVISAIPRRSDLILYDELIHASIHDGIRLSAANSQAFTHNNVTELELLLSSNPQKTIFVIVESIYSMDGDAAPLILIQELCQKYEANLIVDEAHSTGIYGKNGEGLCVALGIEKAVFARIHTFGKAIGTHGAAVLGSSILRDYLINYARPLIYTTALSPHTTQSTLAAYQLLEKKGTIYSKELRTRIEYFQQKISNQSKYIYIKSNSPIQCLLVPGNEVVSQLCELLQAEGYDVRPIRTPTVPSGKERIRICLHRHNSLEEIDKLITLIIN
jgi:8-amino-7-oxononanoate synthase